MKAKLAALLNVKHGEWALLFPLLLLLATNTLVLELADVVATAGFISNVGIPQILLVWVIDMVITLISAGLYSMVVDRTARVRLVRWFLIAFAVLYFIMQILFRQNAPDWLTYPLLYILADQQYVIFPLAFWALANDVYTMAESKRLFPIIAAGAAIGSILGNVLAAISGSILDRLSWDTSSLLAFSGVLFLLGTLVIWLTFRRREVRARRSKEERASVKDTIQVGMDYIKDVPLFRYLAVIMLLVMLALTILEYHFLFTMESAYTDEPLRLQTFYGIYKVALVVTTLLFQWLVAGKLMEKAAPKNAFFGLPGALAVAVGTALAFPGIAGGAAARFIGRLMESSWDEPARKSVENLVPDERRGRVSVFIDSYFYALSTIIGCAVLGLLILIRSLGWVSADVITIIYLGLAGVASLVALWAATRLRATYDESLLNWRLARSRRKSILDGIDFG
jgi:MFS family permease